jgi:predicted Fe-Mo cluster-binding NifX family protein
MTMKILLTTASPDIEAQLDPRFGRGAYFLIVDADTLEWRALPNPSLSARGGAGIQAAQYAAREQAEAVISGHFGPNAADALKQAGISLYEFGPCQTAREALDQWKAGKLQQA